MPVVVVAVGLVLLAAQVGQAAVEQVVQRLELMQQVALLTQAAVVVAGRMTATAVVAALAL